MIPRLLAITPPSGPVPATCVEVAATLGVPLAILLREPGGSPLRLLGAGTRVRALLRAAQRTGATVLLSCDAHDVAELAGRAQDAGVDGLQLRGDPSPQQLQAARELWPTALLGASVHGDPPPVHDADYRVFAPVYAPGTPGAVPKPAAGLDPLRRWSAAHPRVFALGGITGATAGPCIEAGAYGLAGISTFLGPLDTVADTVAALASVLARAENVSPQPEP